MERALVFMLLLLVTGCSSKPKLEDIPKLNGYWEIAKVTFSNGQEKEYTISTTVEYIEVTGQKGFKKKMQPKLNGTYDTSNDAEYFTIDEKEGQLFLAYKNALSAWEEQLLELDETSYSISNQEQITYTYKRYEAINITP